MTDERLARQLHGFEALQGRRVTSWFGVEVALTGSGRGPAPVFSRPDVPCLQLLGLGLACDDGSSFVVETARHDDGPWGLVVTPGTVADPDSYTGITRARPLPELPVGSVAGDRLVVEEGVVAEVGLSTASPLLLIAGEVTGTAVGALRWRRLEGFVLVFTSPEDADGAPWQTPRG